MTPDKDYLERKIRAIFKKHGINPDQELLEDLILFHCDGMIKVQQLLGVKNY